MSFELACHDWTMEKHSSVLEDELMEDAPGYSVSAGSTPAVTARKVNAPVWLQRAYEIINNDLQSMELLYRSSRMNVKNPTMSPPVL